MFLHQVTNFHLHVMIFFFIYLLIIIYITWKVIKIAILHKYELLEWVCKTSKRHVFEYWCVVGHLFKHSKVNEVIVFLSIVRQMPLLCVMSLVREVVMHVNLTLIVSLTCINLRVWCLTRSNHSSHMCLMDFMLPFSLMDKPVVVKRTPWKD